MSLRRLELYFGGAEVPTWRKALAEVPHVAVNYLHLQPRINKRPWLLSEHFPDGQAIFVQSGASGADKKHWTLAQHESFLSDYLSFVQDNLDRLTYFTEYDTEALGLDWVLRQREVWAGLADEKFVPVWHEAWGAPLLRKMVEEHPNLGVPPVSSRTQNQLSSLVRRTRLNLHGLSFSHPYDEPGGLYSTIVSSSWISPTRFGETIVWDNNRLRRYSADDKEKVRRRYHQHFSQAGFDAEAILADDSSEVTRYTIWAWRQLEMSMEGPDRRRLIRRRPEIATNGGPHPPRDTGPGATVPVDIEPPSSHRNGDLLPATVGTGDSNYRTPLPVFNFQEVTSTVPSNDGLGTQEIVSRVPLMGDIPLRQCDSCSLAVLCPLFESGSSCRYSIPVEIRTRDQLLGILSSLLEMQGQRVAFGFFSEQLNGGYPDANLSAELDRFMRMTQSVKDIQDNRDFLRVTVEGRAQTGVLRRLFGAERAETLRRVDPDRAEEAVRRTMG